MTYIGPGMPLRFTPLRGDAFSPLNYAGLQQWVDVNAITGLVDNDPASTYPDLSGNARDFTKAGGNRPLYKPGGLNGQPFLRPDNIDDFMSLGAALTLTGAFTIVDVVRYAALSGKYISGTSANNRRRITAAGAAQITINGSAVTVSTASLSAATWYILIYRRDGSNNLSARANGTDITTGAPTAAGTASFTHYFGSTGADTSDVDSIASLIWNVRLSDAECVPLESYLGSPH